MKDALVAKLDADRYRQAFLATSSGQPRTDEVGVVKVEPAEDR